MSNNVDKVKKSSKWFGAVWGKAFIFNNITKPFDDKTFQLSCYFTSIMASTSAPDNIRTPCKLASGSSKYGPIVKTASTE